MWFKASQVYSVKQRRRRHGRIKRSNTKKENEISPGLGSTPARKKLFKRKEEAKEEEKELHEKRKSHRVVVQPQQGPAG